MTQKPDLPSLDKIPTIGPDGMLTSYLGAFRYFTSSGPMVQEGYDKFKGAPFKLPRFKRWLVVVSSHKLVEELRKAGDDELSLTAAVAEVRKHWHSIGRESNENQDLAADYTLGRNSHTNPYHVSVLRNQLNRNLAVLFPQTHDEIVRAFDETIPLTGDWTKVCAYDAASQIVCRVANRMFVGAPLCKDPDWLALNLSFSKDVVLGGRTVSLLPRFLQPIAVSLLTNINAQVRRGMRHLVPVIQDRQQHIDEYGQDWDNKPNDMLSWLMDAARGDEKSMQNITRRILVLNFAAIFTTTMSFTHALFSLAAMPHYIKPLREEVEVIINNEGWSKASLDKMQKVDSFLRESQRYNTSAISMVRLTLKDFTFSDGTVIPKGTFVGAAQCPIHHDEENYVNAGVFDGFRFVNKRMSEGENAKHQLVATDPVYLPFGHGRHACPGRHFAANLLKGLLAHLVLNYDVKLENEGVRPTNMWIDGSLVPNQTAEVMFKERRF
ncbi:hypothetical protein PILCRDRAFT_769584 [Piloderma croceum F 1598]|uniref:Cytochrome P450 n=1 Tax=Piloderma croceum (strain F 1598) TaxID=765440 RepID=A0A0C3CFP0_PILCF|nr:hypothetical protein PILCRDRAFT_769584 [Piloderma croceum F 1598]